MTDDNGDNGVAVGKTNGQTSANQVIDQGDPEPAHPAHWGFLNSGIVFAAIPIVLFLGTMAYELGFALQLGIPPGYIAFSSQNMAVIFFEFAYSSFWWFVGFLVAAFVVRFFLHRSPSPGLRVVVFLILLIGYTVQASWGNLPSGEDLRIVIALFCVALFFALSTEASAWFGARHRTGARGKSLAHEYRLERHRPRPMYIFWRSVGIGLALVTVLFAQGISAATTGTIYPKILNGPEGFVAKDEILMQLKIYGSQVVAAPVNPNSMQIGEKTVVFSIDGDGTGLQTLPVQLDSPLKPRR